MSELASSPENRARSADVADERQRGGGGRVRPIRREDVPAVVGLALWFLNFSTWRGTHGVYLEDLYVSPEHRRGGIGAALIRRVAEITLERGGARLEWTALHWNEPALAFYEKLGAKVMHEWRTHRLDGETLRRVADAAS